MELLIKIIFGILGKAMEAPDPEVIIRNDFSCEAVLEIDAKTAYAIGLGPGEQVVLREGLKENTVTVLARGKAMQFTELGTVTHAELYENVVSKRARGKIASVNGGAITVTFSC